MVTHLEKEIRVVPLGNSPRACVYIYFEFQERDLHTIRNLLANLLVQLIVSLGDTSGEVIRAYQSCEQKRQALSEADCLRLIKSELASFSQVFLLLDGLDECSRPNTNVRQEFLKIIAKLPEKVKILATSRPDRIIREEFCPGLEFRITATDDDLRSYIHSRVSDPDDLKALLCEGSRQDSSYREHFFSTILENALETFLLAQLHMDILAARDLTLSTGKELRQSLENLPTTWSDVYRQALERIIHHDEDTKSLAFDILNWVFCTRRLLTFDELAHALFLQGHRAESGSNAHFSVDVIKSACRGLVIIDCENKIRLLHHTVQEFLERQPQFASRQGRSRIAQACLHILLDLPDGAVLGYVVNNWGFHVTSCDPATQELVVRFLCDQPKVHDAVQLMDLRKLSKGTDVTGLHLAAYFGLKAVTQRLLSRPGTDINKTTQHGQTALYWAILFGQGQVAKKLMEHGADLNVQESIKGRTALHQAIFDDSPKMTRLLFDYGSSIDVNIVDKEKWSPLRLAVKNGRLNAIEPLVGSGADIYAEDTDGFTAMKWAADIGDKRMVEKLIKCGIDVNKPTKRGWLVLVSAAQKGRADLVQMLIEHGADVNKIDGDSWSPLWGAVLYGHGKVVVQLLQAGADIKTRHDTGRTVLHLMFQQWEKCAKRALLWLLLEHDQTVVNEPDDRGLIPLYVALANCDSSVIWMLLENGANSGATEVTSRGMTPIHIAAERGDKYIVLMLIEKGARGDINKPDNRGMTPLHLAASQGHDSVARLLLERGASINAICKHGMTALHKATEHGRKSTIDLLLRRGADQSILDLDDRPALHIAVIIDDIETTRLLILNTTVLDHQGQYKQSAMHIAAAAGYTALVQELATKNALLNTHDERGRTPLHLAVAAGNKDMAAEILRLDADMDQIDHAGNTAVHVAAEEGNQELLDLFLGWGRPPELGIRNHRGLTAMDVAIENGHTGLNWSPLETHR